MKTPPVPAARAAVIVSLAAAGLLAGVAAVGVFPAGERRAGPSGNLLPGGTVLTSAAEEGQRVVVSAAPPAPGRQKMAEPARLSGALSADADAGALPAGVSLFTFKMPPPAPWTAERARPERDAAGDGYSFLQAQGRYTAGITSEGVSLTFGESAPAGTPPFSLRLKSAGSAGSAGSAVRLSGNTVEIPRGGEITEWYRNTAGGVMQGFTLARPLSGDAPEKGVRLELAAAETWTTVADAGATSVRFRHSATGTEVGYENLIVSDSTGRRLPARMEPLADGSGVALLASDAGAVYPVTVDPLFTVRTLTAHGFPVEGLQPGRQNPLILGNTLFFMPLAADGGSIGIWKVSLTGPSEPRLVGDVVLPNTVAPAPIGKLGNRLYLWHQGQFLSWTEDSLFSTVETFRLPDFPSGGPDAGTPGPFLFERNGRAHFLVLEAYNEYGLWSTDGASLRRELTLQGGQRYVALNGDVIVIQTPQYLGWFKSPEETGPYEVGDETLYVSINGAKSLNGTLFFRRGEGIAAVRGTESGILMVADEVNYSDTTVLGNYAYFRKSNRLWRTDAAASLSVVSDTVRPGGPVFAVNGALYFTGSVAGGEQAVYRSDGTSAGTAPLKAAATVLAAGETVVYIQVLTGVAPNQRRELWASDGTEQGTKFLKDTTTTGHATAPDTFRIAGNHLLFQFNNIPWRSDGTPEGTRPLFPETPAAGPVMDTLNDPVPAGSRVFFRAGEMGGDYGLWVADTATGSARLLQAGQYGVGPVRALREGVALYVLPTVHGGWDLWKSDGTPEGTVRLKEVTGDPVLATTLGPEDLTVSGGVGWFFARLPATAAQGLTLFRTDGTAEGTVAVKGGFYERFSTRPFALTAYGTGALFCSFTPTVDGGGFNVWHSDGTEAGTAPVGPGPFIGDSAGPWILTSEGTTFVQLGAELWTDAGTPLSFRKFQEGTMLMASGGRLYFVPREGGAPLASSDGTDGNLTQAAPLPSSPGPARIPRAVRVGDTVYLQGSYGFTPEDPLETMRVDAFDAVTLSRHPLAVARDWFRSDGFYTPIVAVGDRVAFWHAQNIHFRPELWVAGKAEAEEVPGALGPLMDGPRLRVSGLAPDGNRLYYFATGVFDQDLRVVTVEEPPPGASLRVVSYLPSKGTVTGDADGVTEAVGLPVTATPAAGYYFSHWGGAGVADPLSASTTVIIPPGTALHEVTAFFSVMPQTFAEWTAAFELSGADAEPGAAPAGDGAANLLKHAFAMEPATPATVLRTGDPQGGLPLVTVEPAEAGLTLEP